LSYEAKNGMKLGYEGHLNTRKKFPKKFFSILKISLLILDELKEPRFWGKREKIRRIKGARAMYSVQDWR
jgi:hypothetical protein